MASHIMNKTLVILILVVIVLSWKFVFSSDEKLEFTDQAKVLQGLSAALGYKAAIQKYWQVHKHFPDAGEWEKYPNKPSPDLSKSIVGEIKVGEAGPGAISVYYVDKPGFSVPAGVAGKTIMLTPKATGERLVWQCTGAVAAEFLPKKCSPVFAN